MADDTVNNLNEKKKGFFGFGKAKKQEVEEDPYPEKAPGSSSSSNGGNNSPDEAVGFEECVLEGPAEENKDDTEVESDPFILLAKLRQRIENLEKNKSDTNRAFSEMNRTVGELRSRIMEQEKYIDVLESKANIANDLVRTIDPAQLGKDFEEQKAKIDAIDAKIESFISLSDSVKTEISNVDSKISAIGTPDDIKSMNKDMQNMLKGIIERESRLSAKLEKSDSLFYDMQKNYTESLRFFSTVDAINTSLQSIMSEYHKIEIALRNYVPSDLFSKRISEIEHFLKHLETKYSAIVKDSGIRENVLSGESIVISDSVKNINATEEIDALVKSVEGGPARFSNASRTSSIVSPRVLRNQLNQSNQSNPLNQPNQLNKSLPQVQSTSRNPSNLDEKKPIDIKSRNKSDYDDMIFSRSY